MHGRDARSNRMIAAPPLTSLLLWIHAALPAAHAGAPDARFALALYCDPVCDDAVLDQLEQDLAGVPAVNGFDEVATAPGRLMGMANTGSDAGTDAFDVPDADFIVDYGVGVDRPEALSASDEVVLAWFAAPPEDADAIRRAALQALARAASEAHGWVEDLDTQRVYGQAAWAALDPDGPLLDWFVVESAPGTDGVRLLTRGLRRFADAELVMEHVADADAPDAARVLNAVAAALHGGRDPQGEVAVDADGVRGTAVLSAILPIEGDPDAPLLAVRFSGELDADGADPAAPDAASPAPAPVAASPAPAPVAASPSPAPVAASPAPEPVAASPAPASGLEAARAAMRARLGGYVHGLVRGGIPAGVRLAVCVPFPTPDGSREFLWVEVREWRDATITGTLLSAPARTRTATKGERVTAAQADVFDYILRNVDGTKEGNTLAAYVQNTQAP